MEELLSNRPVFLKRPCDKLLVDAIAFSHSAITVIKLGALRHKDVKAFVQLSSRAEQIKKVMKS